MKATKTKISKTKKDLEKAVRKQLVRSEFSNNRLADETGISATSIQYLRTDERKMSLEKLMILADFFKISYLFRGPTR